MLAIARAEGYEPYALSFRYGQRHSVELDAAGRVAEALGVARHVVADIDLRVFGGSALTDDIERAAPRQRRGPGRRDPGHLRAGPQHHLPVVRAGLGRDAGLPATSSSASTRWTTAATPTAARSTSRAYEQMANLATKAGVEGTPAAEDPHAADRADEGADHRARPGARRGLRAHAQLLRPGPDGPRLRHLRLVPAAPQRLRRGRA